MARTSQICVTQRHGVRSVAACACTGHVFSRCRTYFYLPSSGGDLEIHAIEELYDHPVAIYSAETAVPGKLDGGFTVLHLTRRHVDFFKLTFRSTTQQKRIG